MAYQKLQVSDGLAVIISDTVNIPDPSTIVILDRATGQEELIGAFNVAGTLTDVGTKFTELGIQPGAIVYNTTAGTAYYVQSVDSDTQLTIYGDVAGGATDRYNIYNAAGNGCVLYVGTAGNIDVRLAAYEGNKFGGAANQKNASLVFKNLPNASFLPTQVVRVNKTDTTASDIIALF